MKSINQGAGTMSEKDIAVIVGTGSGLSASLARRFAGAGMQLALAARNIDKLQDLAEETGAKTYACDASEAVDVEALFAAVRELQAESDNHSPSAISSWMLPTVRLTASGICEPITDPAKLDTMPSP